MALPEGFSLPDLYHSATSQLLSSAVRVSIMSVRVTALAFSSPLTLRPPTHATLVTRTRRRHHQAVLPSAKFSAPNPARTAAITGGSGGIGAETARGLVRNLPNLEHLYLLCRDVAKGESVAEQLRAGAIAGRRMRTTVLPVELLRAGTVTACADALLADLAGAPLDLLLCNAGIMAAPLAFSANGGAFDAVESQFAVNHLAHALLVERLLGPLRAGRGRAVFVSSMALTLARARKAPPLLSEKTGAAVTAANYTRWAAYGDSKLAMSMYARALAQREQGAVECVSLHPGVVQTELARHILPRWLPQGALAAGGAASAALTVFGFKTVEQGARLSVQLACAGPGEVENGEMYIGVSGRKAPAVAAPLLRNDDACAQVLEDTQRFVQAYLRVEAPTV